jgi:hypothetical protein
MWRTGRRTLFHLGSAASTMPAPPENLSLKGPTLHRRVEKLRSPPHPRSIGHRMRRGPKLSPAGAHNPRTTSLFASLDCSRTGGFGSPRC